MALRQNKQFKLTEADRLILNQVGPTNHGLFAKHYFDVDLFPWQKYFLAYPCKNKLVVAGIRTGKSFMTAFMLLHFAFWNPGSRVLNVCITADQAQIIFNDIMMLCDSGLFKHWVDKVTHHPYPVIRLVNGSEIWCRSIGGATGDASTLRGWEFDVVNIDEAAYVVNEIAVKTLMGRLIGVNKVTRRPRYGMLTMTTTPKGAKSWLFDRWKLGDPSYPQANPARYLSLRARTFDNTLLSRDVIDSILENYTERQKEQELEGIFIADDGLFAFEDLMRMTGKDLGSGILDLSHIDPTIIELEKAVCDWIEASGRERPDGVPQTIEHYELEPQPGHFYVAGWDLGARAVLTGRAEGRNATVGVVYDVTSRPWKQVAFRYDTQGRYTISMEWVKQWHTKYNGRGSVCQTRIDALGPGDVIHQMLEEEKYRIDGFKAATVSKGAILQAAAVSIERGWIRAPFIRRQVDQFQSYTPGDDKHIAQDIVIASAQAIHLAREIEGGVSESEEVVRPVSGSIQGVRSQHRGNSRAVSSRREAWKRR